jgi:hypothetical protein
MEARHALDVDSGHGEITCPCAHQRGAPYNPRLSLQAVCVLLVAAPWSFCISTTQRWNPQRSGYIGSSFANLDPSVGTYQPWMEFLMK